MEGWFVVAVNRYWLQGQRVILMQGTKKRDEGPEIRFEGCRGDCYAKSSIGDIAYGEGIVIKVSHER